MSLMIFGRCVQVPKQINIKEELQKYTESLGAGRGRGRGRGRNCVLKVQEITIFSSGRGDISRGRLKILEGREQRRQEDIRNALKMKEQWELEKEQKMKQ